MPGSRTTWAAGSPSSTNRRAVLDFLVEPFLEVKFLERLVWSNADLH
jgi:hypothetical protein